MHVCVFRNHRVNHENTDTQKSFTTYASLYYLCFIYMTKEKLVQQIELIRQRLETNKKKLARRANDPQQQILAEMYKVLAKYVKVDEQELERLNQQVIALGGLDKKKEQVIPIRQPNPKKIKPASQTLGLNEQDELIINKLDHLVKYVYSLNSIRVWNKDSRKRCVLAYQKQAHSTRALLTPTNMHLHAFAYKQLNLAQKSFQDWYRKAGGKLTEASPELDFQGNFSLQLKAIQTKLAILESRTPFSRLELAKERQKVQSAIDETGKWLEAKLSSTNRRKLPDEKRQVLHQKIRALQIKLNQWSQSQGQRLARVQSNPPVPSRPQPVQTSAPIAIHTNDPNSALDYVTVQIPWKDISFKDGYVQIRSLLSVSHVYHYLNYSLSLTNSRRSFQAFAPILDGMGVTPLEVWVSVRDGTVAKVLNADSLTDLIGFLEAKETFGWLEWDVYQGSPQYVDNRQVLNQHPSLDRHICLRYLLSLQSSGHRTIFVREYSSASENGRSSTASDAFLFTIRQEATLYIIWENEEKSLATYIFKTTPQQYYMALQRIYDYVASPTIQAKRMRLREGDLQPMQGLVRTCQFLIHDDLNVWRNKLFQLLR